MSLFATIATVLTIADSGKNNNRPFRSLEYGPDGGGYIEAFVSHGINNFNGNPIIDLSSSGFGRFFTTPTYETHLFNKSGSREILPTSSTDRNLELVMGRELTDFFSLFGTINVDRNLFNKPYYDIGTITSVSTNIDERFIPLSFENLPQNPSSIVGQPYFPDSVNPNPTLTDWEQASGIIIIDCNNSSAIVYISICNALPEAIYTVFEVGVTNPGQPFEGVYGLPVGGVGNVFRTDNNGNGEININLAWCPTRECVVNKSVDCQMFFNVNHNSDYIVYGGDIAGYFWTPWSYPTGVVGANHLWFPIHGELLQEPLNRYNKRQCKRGGRGNGRRMMDAIESNDENNLLNVDNVSLIEIIFIGAVIVQVLILCAGLSYYLLTKKPIVQQTK